MVLQMVYDNFFLAWVFSKLLAFTLLFMDMWMKNIACHISKQRMLQLSRHHIITTPRKLKVEAGCPIQQLAAAATHHTSHPPPGVAPWGVMGWEAQDAGPRWVRRISKGYFNKLRLCIHRKALNSLTWDIWVSLIRDNLGTTLLIQWLRICLPMQGTQVWSLVWELRSHMPRGNQATTTEPKCSRAYDL